MFLHIGMKLVGNGRMFASQETSWRDAEGMTGREETTPPTSYHKARALVTLGTSLRNIRHELTYHKVRTSRHGHGGGKVKPHPSLPQGEGAHHNLLKHSENEFPPLGEG